MFGLYRAGAVGVAAAGLTPVVHATVSRSFMSADRRRKQPPVAVCRRCDNAPCDDCRRRAGQPAMLHIAPA